MKSQIAFSHHLQEKSTAETIKSGAKTVGSYLQQGWNTLKSGVSKANTKFKEAEVFRSLNCYLDREENRRRCEQSEGEPVHPEGRSWSAYSRHVCGRGSEENWEGDQERGGSNHPEKRASRLDSDSHQREASYLSCLLEQTIVTEEIVVEPVALPGGLLDLLRLELDLRLENAEQTLHAICARATRAWVAPVSRVYA